MGIGRARMQCASASSLPAPRCAAINVLGHPMRNWITLTEAVRQLGVQAQTVYAYVSRGNIAVMPDPHDPRKSLYRAEDVAGLCRKKQMGRKREALAAGTIFGAEPCIYSSITTFSKGRPYYRG